MTYSFTVTWILSDKKLKFEIDWTMHYAVNITVKMSQERITCSDYLEFGGYVITMKNSYVEIKRIADKPTTALIKTKSTLPARPKSNAYTNHNGLILPERLLQPIKPQFKVQLPKQTNLLKKRNMVKGQCRRCDDPCGDVSICLLCRTEMYLKEKQELHHARRQILSFDDEEEEWFNIFLG